MKLAKPSRFAVHLGILPRWFAAPVVLLAILLGSLLAGGPTWATGLALLAGLLLMASLHSLNTWTDWRTGVDAPLSADSPLRSTKKWYTSGSQAIAAGWATPRGVLVNALSWLALATASVAVLAWQAGSGWPFLGWGLGLVFGGLYSPVWKYKGFPEACGLFAFGAGGMALGYSSVTGEMDLARVFLVGVGVSGPWAASWVVDQAVDAPSDLRKGVYNIGTLAYVTGYPMWAHILFGVSLSYMMILFLIQIGFLSPWAFMSIGAVPLWVLTLAWLNKDVDRGIKYGLVAIFVYMLLLTAGQWIGG